MPQSTSRTMSRLRLQRRHYQFIAETIAQLALPQNRGLSVAEVFAYQLSGTNPGYDYARFLRACGPKPALELPRCLLCQSESR